MSSHLAMRNYKGGVGWLMFIMLIGCTPNNDLEFPSFQNYFPLQVGDYKIYQVAETQIALNVFQDIEYQLKIVVTDSFINAEGEYSYILSRLKRFSESEPWVGFDTWVAKSNESELVISEQNIPYVKLSFPVVGNKEWNSNKYNNEYTGINCPDVFNTCNPYRYSNDIGSFQTTTGLQFENVIEVVESDVSDPIKIDIRKTKYAFDAGLVYKETNHQELCGVACTGQFVNEGLVQTIMLIEYGRE